MFVPLYAIFLYFQEFLFSFCFQQFSYGVSRHFLTVLGFELRTLCFLGECSTT
jgi:hypothetical protein